MVNVNRDRAKRVIVSVDWGYTNPGIMLVWAVDGDGRLYLIHEVYQSKKLISWWIERAKEINLHFRPEVFVCDPSEPEHIAEFRTAGIKAVKANNAILIGIQKIADRLAPAGDGKPRIFFFRDALVEMDTRLDDVNRPTSTIQEFPGYVWQKSADGKPVKEQPVKDNDHGMDAMRYAVMYLEKRRSIFV